MSTDTIEPVQAPAPGKINVIKREKHVDAFDQGRIENAIKGAYLDVEGDSAAGSARIQQKVTEVASKVTLTLQRRMPSGGTVDIEEIQDLVELELMRSGEHKVAREYVLFRERQAAKRAAAKAAVVSVAGAGDAGDAGARVIHVTGSDGTRQPLDQLRLQVLVSEACEGLEDVDADAVVRDVLNNLYDGVNESDLNTAVVMAARTRVEMEPNYSFVTARLLLDGLRSEALQYLGVAERATQSEMERLYGETLPVYLERGVALEQLDPALTSGQFDIPALAAALDGTRDNQFTYLGLQTLYDRYFLHKDDVRYELPQLFYMRVAMGLAINEDDCTSRAIEFYTLLSAFDYMTSTPTLFNAGTLRPQLSSCYLTNIPDDLHGIYGALQDNAMLSKFAGGLGNDWTPVRAMGAYIKGTNGKSQGVVPFLKVANDTAVAVNQGGKRKGAVCAYLESWHLDVEEFLELRKNTGDDRRRTHDMNTANWIPDLFMKRVFEDGSWTLFSPSDVPDLHDLFGKVFEQRYTEYEAKAARGEIRVFKTVRAGDLWRKMLAMLFETGHPWLTFKDPCNVRSPQQHVGVVHSSNLCTEITLNTKAGEEIAVCNLGSVNLPRHIDDNGELDSIKLRKTVRTAMRMLDNVIDINYYGVKTARDANLRHRPVGLGIMGFQDALYKKDLAYASDAAVDFADRSMELVSYFAIEASTELAEERGHYQSYPGSLWSEGILPIDSIALLAEERGEQFLGQDQTQTLDWDSLRDKVLTRGMRNSNCMAIAPTATIANICGVSQSIEPTYQNLYVKSNLSGEFTVVNPYLVSDLKALDLWDAVMVNDLKYYEGSLQNIARIPDALKQKYATAFEVEAKWLVDAASRRQKWLDQSQSLNLYIAGASGKKLDLTYRMAWYRGLKTTYYLRALAATSTEKSTVQAGALNAVKA